MSKVDEIEVHGAIVVSTSKENYSIEEVCPHNVAETKVLEVLAGCERTVTACTKCGEHLDEPKTNC